MQILRTEVKLKYIFMILYVSLKPEKMRAIFLIKYKKV